MSRFRLAVLMLALAPLPLAAQGWIDVWEPNGRVRMAANLVRVGSSVRAIVEGRVARFEVEERFRNTGGTIAEGTYLYPLPGEAVFSDFSLFQGDQELKGEMMSADQARSIYEGIVRRLKDPALITLVGHGLIRAQVFPVQPGETRKVILRYTQLLGREQDALRLRYAAGDRGDAPVAVSVEVRREAEFATPYSPTHAITERRTDGVLRLTVASPVKGDLDLVLPFRRGLVGGTVLAHAEPRDDGFALLFLSPPAADGSAGIGRDITLVVDVSGSMSGEKLEQARAALRQAVGSLRPVDRFRLISFSNGVRHFREGFTPATANEVAEARRFIDGLAANGGTNLEGAVQAALAEAPAAGRLPLVLLLTDGLPSVGEQEPDRIAAAAAGRIGRSRIFTFGIGHDVNTYLLDRLAVEGHGSASYVAPGADVGDAVGGVLTKLSRPALTDLRIVESPVRFLEQTPAELPDLFYGEELVVMARYQGQGNGPVVIEGSRNGRRERFTIEGRFPGREADNDYIPPLWAARRIGELTRQARLEGQPPALVERIRELGLRYGIITEYTAYLVQEPGTVVAGPLPAPAPMAARAMTGSAAFDLAERSAKLAQSATLSAANEAAAAPAMAGRETRRAGGRILVRKDGTWVDAAHRDSLPVRTIAPFSRAWFELVAARPALRECLAAGAPLVLGGKRVSLKVAEGGDTTWAPGALDRFLADFEGR